MNRIIKYIAIISLFAIVISTLALTSCHKDRSMEAVITVKLMSDTMVILSGVRVEMSEGDVSFSGYTDGNGEFRQSFEQPVQLNIRAFNDTLSGIGVINIGEYEKDYAKSVFIY